MNPKIPFLSRVSISFFDIFLFAPTSKTPFSYFIPPYLKVPPINIA
jgi:hypothetical protein